GEPLYILVSLWCKLQEKWISRNDIAEAFGINLRRASFIITYISRRKEKISFRVRYVSYGNLHYKRLEIFIYDVNLEAVPIESPVSTGPKRKNYRVGNGIVGQSNIWNEMIMRRKKEN
ncbi:type III secretion system LEE transcriptional regulator GrlA, partial [Escherichia coli]|nr:type III secretion system LEE transcriptional regulator GrlA [Escherichia coli]EER8932149.1 type III secretion system LEE transcriptional regulator GrlA [Escherichia coli]EER9210278.1 type III secretion system LEE transcriptional regulator GrlA [Escherichia coli]EER9386227.1 type III secretion system LEE transcriptional regulator GrlA [Escherichia coli]EER9829052.1 type III secretion system LEE transcriptional regulator GrlA [Escherichia coli]